MPFACHVAPEHRLAAVYYRGAVTAAVLDDTLRTLPTHPGWQPGFDILRDFRDATARIDLPDMIRAVEFGVSVQAHIGRGRDVTLVRDASVLDRLLSETFSAFRNQRPNMLRTPLTVLSTQEAADHLALPPGIVEALLASARAAFSVS